MNRFRSYFYKVFGHFIADIHYRERARVNKARNQTASPLEEAFRALEKSLSGIKYPNNDFNKMMSMILSDLEIFEHIVLRFRKDRTVLAAIAKEDNFLYRVDRERKSYPAHPDERAMQRAIKIDAQSLFVFGNILIYRSLLLLKMYLSDNEPGKDIYKKLQTFYYGLLQIKRLSPLGEKFKTLFIEKIKWHYAVLRFYRNEFVEHLDKGMQQGMNFGLGTSNSSFSLASYKWDFNDSDNLRIEDFRTKLESRGIKIPERKTGGRSLVNRCYIQKMFENIALVPHDLLEEALKLIDDIGGNSPEPEKIILETQDFIVGIFDFMRENLADSELAKHKVC